MALPTGASRRFVGTFVALLGAISSWSGPLRADCSTAGGCAQRGRSISRLHGQPLESDGSTVLIVSGAALTTAGLLAAVAGTVLTFEHRSCTGLEGYQYVRTHSCTGSGLAIGTYFMAPLLLGTGVPLLAVGMQRRARAAAARATLSPWVGSSSVGVAYRLEL